MDSHCGGDLIVDDELTNVTEGFQVGVVIGSRRLVSGISFESVGEVCKRTSSCAWFEMLQSAQHDFGVNVNSLRVNSVAGLSMLGLIGSGWRVELFAELFHVAVNGGNRHGLGEASKGRAVVVCIGCHLSSFSISLALIRGGDAMDVVSGFVKSREVSKTELAETTPHHNIGIICAVR